MSGATLQPTKESIKKISTSLPDVFVLEPRVFGDARGFFLESYSEKVFSELGIPDRFVQDNHSFSMKNVLRGLHYQIQHAQGKLVRVADGEILDVAVDLRRSSPTFGKSEAVRLSGDEQAHVVDPCRIRTRLPRDFGNGARTLQGDRLLRA